MDDVDALSAQLRELAELHATGALDADEHALARRRVLGGAPATPSGGLPAIGPTVVSTSSSATLVDRLSRIITVGGYGMPLAVPVVAATVAVVLVLVVALASIR